jgi:predicted nicotinamide N-methyase
MSASLSGSYLPPSSSLIPIRSLITASGDQINTALKSLQALYCPLRLPATISRSKTRPGRTSATSKPAPIDSGYASQDEDEEDDALSEEVTAAIRADPFERTFSTKWLTALIARCDEMDFDEDARESIIENAGSILSAFFESTEEAEEDLLTRDFPFSTSSGNSINVTLNDAARSGADHTDVGLQSWGAGIVLSSMLCSNPERFGLTQKSLPDATKIIELGAGTGLVSLTLAKIFLGIGIMDASISATDYHPAVVANCKANIELNFPSSLDHGSRVDTAILDWAQPPAHLKSTSNLLVAADVVYAPEHAAWLRDCAAHLLTPGGTFWLMTTIRKHGKFEGFPDTVEAAFADELCPKSEGGLTFRILGRDFIGSKRGIGRGDETGYDLFRIGWA